MLRDMTGGILLRDRGVIRTTVLFDTLGDDTPGGVTLEELDVSVAGPHPGSSWTAKTSAPWFRTSSAEGAG